MSVRKLFKQDYQHHTADTARQTGVAPGFGADVRYHAKFSKRNPTQHLLKEHDDIKPTYSDIYQPTPPVHRTLGADFGGCLEDPQGCRNI